MTCWGSGSVRNSRFLCDWIRGEPKLCESTRILIILVSFFACKKEVPSSLVYLHVPFGTSKERKQLLQYVPETHIMYFIRRC
jgi:hypothetical protein